MESEDENAGIYEQLILKILKDRAHIGATREVFFTAIRGVNYDHLRRDLASLEENGFITIEWLSLDRFEAYITESGEAQLEALRQAIIENQRIIEESNKEDESPEYKTQ